jgi:signal transduction histidine kinase
MRVNYDEKPSVIKRAVPNELSEIEAKISEFTPEEMRALVVLEACVRRTLDPLKVVLLIESIFMDLGFKSEIHVLTGPEDDGAPTPRSFPSPRMIRCPFELDMGIPDEDFGGYIDLEPIDLDRKVTDRERRFLEFCCRQAGFVLAHEWLYQNLSRTREKLQSALNTVSEISAFVGHEIRSPLASLHSLAFLIEDHVQDMSKQERLADDDWELLGDKMGQSTGLLQKVVRSTYLLGTLDVDEDLFRRDLEWVEMGKSLLVSAETAYSYDIRRRNLLVVIRREQRFSSDFIHVHRTWFEAIFDNLLGNAIKYATNGGRIDFSILERESEYAIHVSNPVEHPPQVESLNRLFEKGYRGSSGFSHKSIGANQGLGLYFVNRIVTEGYGGSVRVWLDRNRNEDGCGPGASVEAKKFGDTNESFQPKGDTYFHIEIRIKRSALQGIF